MTDDPGPDDRRIIADGLAAIATTSFEMGQSRDAVRACLVDWWERLGSPANAFEDAAVALRQLPQPISERPEEIERRRAVRQQLGVQSADEQLLAAIEASALLGELSTELG